MHLYIHIPYCISKCDYCDFFSIPLLNKFPDKVPEEISVPDEYVDSLLNEISFRIKSTETKSLSTVYIGGGTPSLLSPAQICRIMNHIKNETTLDDDAEITIEMNPETVSEQKLDACAKNGINRISLGIQSLADSSLNCVHRHCSSKKAVTALEMIKKKWKGHLSVDVIAGLPGSDSKQFLETLNTLIEYNPDHFSMYSLCVEEETPLGKSVIEGPESFAEKITENSDRQWIEGRMFLKENGFRQYEVSNFAKKGFEAVHNSSYWKQEDYLGCGAGACGTLYSFGEVLSDKLLDERVNRGDRPLDANCFRNGIRTTNTTNLERYIDFWKKAPEQSLNDYLNEIIPQEKELLDLQTEEYEFLMMGLRMLSGISEEDYYRHFKLNEEKNGVLEKRLIQNGSLWKEYEKKDYVKVYKNIHNEKYYALNEEGILFLNPLLESLL